MLIHNYNLSKSHDLDKTKFYDEIEHKTWILLIETKQPYFPVMPQQFPEPTVGALIVNPEGKIFLMASPKWKGKYVIPGGHVELGETLEDALRREVKEETNLDIFDIQFLMFLEFIYGPSFAERKHFLFFDYTCKTRETEVRLNEEGTHFVWVTAEEARRLPVESNTEIIIRRYAGPSGNAV